MLKHPTLDQLYALGLQGMAKGFTEIGAEADNLDKREWLGLLLDREASWRQDKRFAARLRYAKLRQQACAEDVDYRSPRGLDRPLFQKLVEGHWIEAHENLALVGPTGVGKSWLASALGHKACRDNRSVLYHRIQSSSKISPWRAAMAVIRASCVRSAAPTFSFSTIGVWSPSTPAPGMIFWKSSKSDTAAARPSSHPNSPWTAGITSSTTRPTPMRSSTVSFTTPIGSNWLAKACDASGQVVKKLQMKT